MSSEGPAMSDMDDEALGRWLRDHVGVEGSLQHEIISGGASNLTIAVTVGGTELVVRRPPIGAFLPSANDVGREYRYLSALRDVAEVPVPEVLGFCEDESVIGAPFYVMRRLHGVVPHEPSVLAHLPADERRAVGEHFVAVLKAIHGVDVDAVGLGGAAKRTGYLERQVARWTDQWHRAKEGDSPVIDELSRRLAASIPPSGPATIVHGDYRLGNVMVSSGAPHRVVGVFDWEMATLGDPLADVGYTLLWWGTDDRPLFNPSQQVADLPGMPSANDVCGLYGVSPDGVRFHIALAAFKLAIIGEGNRARARRLGAGAAAAGGDATPLADWALELMMRAP